MPAQRKPSPSSPATDRQPAASALTRAHALRWWRAGYEAGRQAARHEQQAAAAARWDQLVASYRAQHAADRQAKIDALLLDTIDVLARLLTSPGSADS
jgi:hypothetical protein